VSTRAAQELDLIDDLVRRIGAMPMPSASAMGETMRLRLARTPQGLDHETTVRDNARLKWTKIVNCVMRKLNLLRSVAVELHKQNAALDHYNTCLARQVEQKQAEVQEYNDELLARQETKKRKLRAPT